MTTRRGLLVFLVAAAFTLCGLTADGNTANAASGVILLAGDGEEGFAVNAFLPTSITVTQGSSVRWDFSWYEPHTISFGSPSETPIVSTPSPATYDGTGFVTSDVTFGPGKSYTIQFMQPGTYEYFCLVHPGQEGTVVVVANGSSLADTQASADARARIEYQSALAELKAIAAEARAEPVESHQLPDGTTERVVKIARETLIGDVQQYFPPDLTVVKGDTVTWRSAARTPHTVTLGPFPAGVPMPGNPLVDDQFLPGDSYEGVGYWNSGVLGIDWPLGTEFSLKFKKTGTYAYYCILHLNQGQFGTIEVLAAAAPSPSPATPASPGAKPPLPPATGSGVSADPGRTGTGNPWLLAGLSLAALAMTGLAIGSRSAKTG